MAAVSIYVAPEELARRSPWIVEGTVLATASGFDPLTGTLATYVTVEVGTMHRGPAGTDRIVLREAGGRYGTLVHETDAVPVYRPGERVFVFLEPSRDGALRTRDMFFGKFTVEEDPEGRIEWAVRDLEGQGTILGRPVASPERLPIADLLSVVATDPHHAPSLTAARAERGEALPFSVPEEYDRLLWDDIRVVDSEEPFSAKGTDAALSDLQFGSGTTNASPAFAPLSSTNPARWFETDSGGTVIVHIDPTGNPLGNAAAAVGEVQRALAAWNEVPEARVALQAGDTGYDYPGTYRKSPARLYSATNVVLFDDPYEDISDPSGCSGILAIGGYWRSTSIAGTVNGVAFHSAKQLYVIFNDGFECVLSDPDNLAEITTHELGHGIGFGHSNVPDAIMRASAYGGRGPRLGDDDRDAAHCHYPHDVHLISPDGAEVWEAGSVRQITWSTTPESGPDDGTVDLELSSDGGQSWTKISSGEPNDGSFFWHVPDLASENALVRAIRHSRTGESSSPFPEACSSDDSSGPFSITGALPSAGAVPAAEGGLRLVKGSPDGELLFNWGASCSAEASDYAVYEGSLDSLREGVWDHRPASCSTGGALDTTLVAGEGNRFFLVSPLAGSNEGRFGSTSEGSLRPASLAACAPRETAAACE